MTQQAVCASLTIADLCERGANKHTGFVLHVHIAAIIVGAIATLEIKAGGDTMGSELVREVTIVSIRAGTLLQEFLADGNFVGIMGKSTTGAVGARA